MPETALIAGTTDVNTQGHDNPLIDSPVVFTDADEVIYSRGLEATLQGQAGDDTLYIYDPTGATFAAGGPGADTIVVCSMQAYDLTVVPGTFNAPDEDRDVIVIEADTFLGGTPGFPRTIDIRSFIVGIDTLVLRVPSDLAVSAVAEPNHDRTAITIGDTRITVDHPLLDQGGEHGRFLLPGTESLIIETIDPPPVRPARGPTAPRSIPASCPSLDRPPEGAVFTPSGDRIEVHDHAYEDPFTFTGADDVIIAVGLETDTMLNAGTGDDTLYLYDARNNAMPLGGPGADIFVICSMDYQLNILPNTGTIDDEQDIIVVEPAVFANPTPGLPRHIDVWSFVDGVDTLVLRVPNALEVAVEPEPITGATAITVGDTLITLRHPPMGFDGRPGPALQPEGPSLIIEAAAPAAPTTAEKPSGERSIPAACLDLDALPADVLIAPTSYVDRPFGHGGEPGAGHDMGPGHGADPGHDMGPEHDMGSGHDADLGHEQGPVDYSTFGHGPDELASDPFVFSDADDVIVSSGLETFVSLRAGAGNDTVFVYEPRNQAYVDGGRGDDIIVLCSFTEFTTALWPGRDVDDDADTIVIQPEVFVGIPAGFTRDITLFSFMVGFDRLILRVPPPLTVTTEPQPAFRRTLITVGDTTIQVFPPEIMMRDGPFLSADGDGLVIETAAPVTVPDRAAMTARAAPDTCPSPTAPPPGAGIAPAHQEGQADEHLAFGPPIFTNDDDVIISENLATYGGVDTRAGDDTLYIYDPRSGSMFNGGPGRDLIVLCSMTDYQVLISPYFDAEPDTIVIQAGAFEGVAEGFRREIELPGFVVGIDRLVLRIPEGLSIAVAPAYSQGVTQITVGNTVVSVGHPVLPDGDNSFLSLDSDSLTVEPPS